MDYNQYEATPLFSYDQSRTAIRQIRAENNRQMRQNQSHLETQQANVKWASMVQFGSAGILVAAILVTALFF